MRETRLANYSKLNPSERPAYTIAEAARYLRVPKSTLQSWFKGQRGFRAVLKPADPSRSYLSFLNLTEAHVLSVIRYFHRVPMPKIRRSIQYISQQFVSAHPLVDSSLQTDGLDLFVNMLNELINVSQLGQLSMRQIVEAYLSRIEWDERRIPAKLYPFARKPLIEEPLSIETEPKDVVINPRVEFGRPIIVGTGIRTEIIAERFWAGEAIEAIAQDYALPEEKVSQAIRYQTLIERAEPAAA